MAENAQKNPGRKAGNSLDDAALEAIAFVRFGLSKVEAARRAGIALRTLYDRLPPDLIKKRPRQLDGDAFPVSPEGDNSSTEHIVPQPSAIPCATDDMEVKDGE